jgi:hypothetical protein
MEKGIVIGKDTIPIAIGISACCHPMGSGISLLTILQYRIPRMITVIITDIIVITFISMFPPYYIKDNAI